MLCNAIVLKKTQMKNGRGVRYYLLTDEYGILSINGFSAKNSKSHYLALDYFRDLVLELKERKGEVFLDSVQKINKDYARNFLNNRHTYKYVLYIQQVLIKVFMPLNGVISKTEYEKLYGNLLFLYRKLPIVEPSKALFLSYRFLKWVYMEAGFLQVEEDVLGDVEVLEKIRFYHQEFLDNSFSCI